MGRIANQIIQKSVFDVRTEVIKGFENFDLEDLQNISADNVLNLQQRLGLGERMGSMVFPAEWFPPGVCRTVSSRTLDFATYLAKFVSDPLKVHAGNLLLTRLTLILFFCPHTDGREGAYLLSPSTLVRCMQHIQMIVVLALNVPGAIKSNLFDSLNADALVQIRSTKVLAKEANRIQKLCSRGYFNLPLPSQLYSGVELGPRGLQHRPKKSMPFLPFSDDFVAAAGFRCLWMIDNLDQSILRCLRGCYEVMAAAPGHGRKYLIRRSVLVQDYLSNFAWTLEDGSLIKALPFEVADMEWPPRSWINLKMLARLLQSAHLIVFLLSTGGRISEALSLGATSLRLKAGVDGSANLVEGRTYKLVFSSKGDPKEWPIPDIALEALMNQKELSSLLRTADLSVGGQDSLAADSTDSLWIVPGRNREVNGEYLYMLNSFSERLGLESLLGDANLHPHRFRKTIARLAGLCIAGAPKILMDLFGHETIEMTLHYILSDPLIRAEMDVVLKAQVIMLGRGAIEDAEDAGGPAARSIREAVQSAQHGKLFGVEQIDQLAEILTLAGTHWQLVRPGVICTKLPNQAGACTRGLGWTEPGNCKSYCYHRFEHSILREDIDLTIHDCVSKFVECERDDDEIGREMWAGQILAHLYRFDDIRDKWISHPVVAKVLLGEEASNAI